MSFDVSTREGGCKGISDHRWWVTIEDGQASLTAESCGPACSMVTPIGDTDGTYTVVPWEHDTLHMPPVAVTVHMATDCPAYDTDDDGVPTGPPKPMGGYEAGSHYIAHGRRCDCNWWPVLRAVGR